MCSRHWLSLDLWLAVYCSAQMTEMDVEVLPFRSFTVSKNVLGLRGEELGKSSFPLM